MRRFVSRKMIHSNSLTRTHTQVSFIVSLRCDGHEKKKLLESLIVPNEKAIGLVLKLQ